MRRSCYKCRANLPSLLVGVRSHTLFGVSCRDNLKTSAISFAKTTCNQCPSTLCFWYCRTLLFFDLNRFHVTGVVQLKSSAEASIQIFHHRCVQRFLPLCVCDLIPKEKLHDILGQAKHCFEDLSLFRIKGRLTKYKEQGRRNTYVWSTKENHSHTSIDSE